MTYCIGVKLDDGIIFASDSRTNAGMDNIAKFCKMTVFERKGDRVIVLLSSGNLAGTQAVIGVLDQRCAAGDAVPNLWSARTMFDVAMLVADAMRDIERRDGEYLLDSEVGFNASFIVGGQIRGEPMRLFRIYAEGNFIEAGIDTPYFQTGRDQVRQADHRSRDQPVHPACRCHQVRAGVVRFDHAQQPLRGDADRPDLLRAGQPRGSEAAPVRRPGCVLQRAQPRVERRHAGGVSPAPRPALVSSVTIDTFVITCEHGGNRIPAPYGPLFRGQRALLDSHRGYDPGALAMAQGAGRGLRRAARGLDRQPPAGRPQSLDRPSAALLGGDTRRAGGGAREDPRRGTTVPYRTRVKRLVGDAVSRRRRVVHVSSHSFTPELDGARAPRRRRAALRPGPAWGGRALRPLERSARGARPRRFGCAATTRTPAKATG